MFYLFKMSLFKFCKHFIKVLGITKLFLVELSFIYGILAPVMTTSYTNIPRFPPIKPPPSAIIC